MEGLRGVSESMGRGSVHSLDFLGLIGSGEWRLSNAFVLHKQHSQMNNHVARDANGCAYNRAAHLLKRPR